ncbi:TIGR03013 family PEP-CTERM/XrtA system glycosyltransferase [soil metagenome]
MYKIGNHHFSKNIFLLLMAESILLFFSVLAGAKVRFFSSSPYEHDYSEFLATAVVFTCAMIFSMSASGVFQNQLQRRLRYVLLRLGQAYILGFCIITAVFYVVPALQIGRGILGLMFFFSAAGLLVTRLVFYKSHHSRIFTSHVLIVGVGELAKECGDLVQSGTTTTQYDIAGYIPVGADEVFVPTELILQKETSLYETARARDATDIVVAVQNKRGGGFPIKELLECKMHGLRVTDSAVFFEREKNQIRVNSLRPSWLIFGGGFDQTFSRAFMKRTFDLIASVALAILTLPVMGITVLLIYLEDRGPIFYSQERVGLGGEVYTVFKFRSMGNNAEQAGKPQWAQTNDPRVTRVGAFIRKTRIDELPQIFNVIMGDMSFVGPRPERPFFVDELNKKVPFYNLRHSIKPGITGMAQVRYPYGATVEDAVQKLQYDLYYVKNNSLFLDLLIMIDTIDVVLHRKGAR